jgi:DNA-binding MarR family transcriptional regulator
MNSLRRTILALRIWVQEVERDLGVSGAQALVLEKLAEAPAQSLNELAGRTLTSKAAVSVVVSRLVERGLVRRRASEEDGRSVVLTLTSAGRRTLERSPESPGGRVIAALKRLPREELEEFGRLFELFTVELGIRDMEPLMMYYNETGEEVAPPRPRRPAPAGTRRA